MNVYLPKSSEMVECEHEWRYNSDGWVEGCVPAICIKCGKTGCACDVGDKLVYDLTFKKKFFDEQVHDKTQISTLIDDKSIDNNIYRPIVD